MADQIKIPYTQSTDPILNSVQQYVNKVTNNLNTKIVNLQNLTSQIQGIGDVIFSPLTLSQFQASHSTKWIIANGQSSIGTAYEALTLNKTVPTITLSGATAFIKVN